MKANKYNIKRAGKLIFKYGTMGSSKSAQCIMTGYNYELQGKKVLYYKPETDTRDEHGKIKSRALESSTNCRMIKEGDKLEEIIIEEIKESNGDRVYAVLVDEAQFLSKQNIEGLHSIAITYPIDIICYGLKNSYIEGELFEGSKYLLYYADKLEEIKNVCQYCGRKATMNLLIEDGRPKREGDIIVIGDTEPGDKVEKPKDRYYVPTCSYHYRKPELRR